MFEYIWILLPIGLLIGWLAAKKDIAKKQKILHYLNLRYLLEEQSKETIHEHHIDLTLNDDLEALNFSIILGDAFRKRGEIDRAVNLHEYVIKQSEHSKIYYKAHFSLAEDYLTAGFFDKAEEKLRFLLESDEYCDQALRKLANLFEQQRDWLQALVSLERLSEKNKSTWEEMSHLYCELAEEALFQSDVNYDEIKIWLDKALEADRDCVRANMIKSRVFLANDEIDLALQTLYKIEEQQPVLISVIVPVLYRLSFKQSKLNYFYEWLNNAIAREKSHFLLKIWKTHYLILHYSLDEAIHYLKNVLNYEANLQGLLLLNRLSMSCGTNSESLELYDRTFNQVIDTYAKFQCEKCGLVTKVLQWHCPSCKQWNVNAPVSDIIALKH